MLCFCMLQRTHTHTFARQSHTRTHRKLIELLLFYICTRTRPGPVKLVFFVDIIICVRVLWRKLFDGLLYACYNFYSSLTFANVLL